MHAVKVLIVIVVIAAVVVGAGVVLYEEIVWLRQVHEVRGPSAEPRLPWKSTLKITVVVVGACALIVAGLYGIKAP